MDVLEHHNLLSIFRASVVLLLLLLLLQCSLSGTLG
jgi:hypothetical protein